MRKLAATTVIIVSLSSSVFAGKYDWDYRKTYAENSENQQRQREEWLNISSKESKIHDELRTQLEDIRSKLDQIEFNQQWQRLNPVRIED